MTIWKIIKFSQLLIYFENGSHYILPKLYCIDKIFSSPVVNCRYYCNVNKAEYTGFKL